MPTSYTTSWDLTSELRASVSWPGDEERHADLNVFFFHTPV